METRSTSLQAARTSCATCLVVATSLLVSCAISSVEASRLDARVHSWGSLREVLHDENTKGRVRVADLARTGVFGVGAAAGLAGELTIFDGRVWHSRVLGEDGVQTRRATSSDALATMMFASRIERFRAVTVDRDVPVSMFDEYVAQRARSVGLDTREPFVFVIEGPLSSLKAHVIAGECPIRARKRGLEMASPIFEKEYEATDAQLVGVYAERHARVITHVGSRTHVHVLFDGDMAWTGHVERVGLAKGATIHYPER